MADYTIVEEALKRGYTMDEIADNLARDNGVDPADARGRGYTTGEMMKNLGYVKPETSDVARGFVTSFKQLPQLGYGLLAGAGAVAESVAGEGGVSTSMKNFGVKKYQEAGADIEKDSKQSDSLSYSWEQAKQGDFGSLVDWLQYGIGYGGGQAVQALATAGVGSLVGKTVLKGTAENLASKMVAKEALRLGATEEAKRLTAQEISKIAVANVASNIGQTVAIGSQAFGMEGGEIFGDLAQKTVKEGRAATGGELAKAFGATAAAGALEFVGDKLGVDVMLGKSKMFKPASSMTGVGGRAARAAVAVPGTVLAEGGTEYLQTGIEEYGKGNEKNFLPFMQSESAQKQALDAAGLGAVGGGGMAMVGGAFSSPQKKDAAPSPSPSISSAQTADDAIAAFQDEVASVTPRGSFGNMDELAGFIEAERSDIGKRRGLLAQQQQDARDMENEFNGLVKDEQIDQSYRLNDAQKQRDAARLREGDYSLAEQQRNEQQGRLPEQAEALSNAQGFGEQEPTAMQLAMQRAQQKALDNEFSGLLKQERANLNEMRANVKRVAGVPVEQISTPQLEEIAQSEAHPNTKMAAVAALNDRHDAIQQERERLMQLREARLAEQSQGETNGVQPHAANGQVAARGPVGGSNHVPGGGLDAAVGNVAGSGRINANPPHVAQGSRESVSVPNADSQANVRALTENAAKRQATQLTNQGFPTVAYPHPTQPGMWAIGSHAEAKSAPAKEQQAQQAQHAPVEPAADDVPVINVRQQTPRKKPASNTLAQAIINLGGISTSLKQDITGDASVRSRPGLFTKNGTADLGELAARLSGEFGFTQIDVNDPEDNSGAKQLADLIASSVNGETILNEEAMIRAQQDEEFEQAKAEVNLQAQEIGIKPIRGKRTIDTVQSEINAILAEREEMSRQKKKAQLLLDEVAEQELIEAFDLAMQEYHDETAISRDESRVESARISTEESAQGDGDSVDQASPVAGRASPTEGGRGEAEVTPEFGLVGQTEEEAIAEEQARRDEDQRKADEDRAEDRRIAAEETARRNVQNVNTVASDNFQLGQSRQEVRRMVHSGAGHENANSGEAKDGNTQDSASTEQGGASNSHGERIHPRSDLPDGTRIVDGNGNPYRVHYQRNSLVVAHPIIDGKPVVSADTSVRFWVDPNREASGENDRLDPIYRDTSTSQEQPAVKQNPAEQPKSDSELQQIGSPQWALDMRNRGEVPEGWYVHGRKGRQDLNTNNVIQMTRDWDVADQYAKKDGSQWLIRPAKDATVLDLSSKSSKDMDRVVERAIRDFENGDLDFIEWIEASIGRDATAGDVENAVRESFAPGDIVNSAEAYDNWEFAGWLVDRFGVDFVETPDGAVAMNGDTGIEKVKVPNEGDQVTSTSKQKPADQQADAIEPVQPETPIEPITRRQEMQARGQEARIQDFGAKIGGARKDTAQPIGKRGTVAKDEDSRPAWERKYVAMQDVRTGKWGLNKIVSGSKGATTRVTGAKFDTEAEAIKAIPLADVSRNHRVYSYDEQQGDSQVLKWGIYRNITDRKRALVKGGFDSYEDAMKDMASNPVQIIEHKFEFPERPWLDRIERTGPSVRTGDVTTTMFQDTFGFRGGEFGNWNMGGDGQEALNHAYDALHDLANAIGVAPKALSLNGQLAIAFGARGKGGKNSAAAHYEPGAVVINLTKIKGAGSAAHEWWHALDDYFASESSNSAVSDGFGYKSKARPELVESFKNVVDTIMNSERSRTTDADVIRANAQKRLDAALGDLDYRLNDLRQPYAPKRAFTAEELKQFDALVKKLRNGELGEQVYVASQSKMKGAIGYSVGANIRDLNAIYKQATGRSFLKSDPSSIGRQMQWTVSAISDNKAKLETKESVTSTIKGRSEFYLEARKIDGYRASDYWSMPEEMGARAFESYIFDKLTGTGNRSDYLVYAVENRHYAALGMKPYPEGGERQAINSAFDKLFETVQTKETDAGVAMFNAKSGSVGNPIDTAALESTIASVIAASPSQWSRDTVVTATLFADLPAPIVEKAKAEGYDAHGRNRDGQKLTGATYDGKVYLVQENITSEIEAEETLLHERIHQILHGNAEDENGKALRQSLGRLYSRIGGKDAIVALAKRIGADMSGPLAALPKVAVRNRPAFLVDEFLAHVEGQRAYEKFPQSVVRAIREFYGEFRDWLRSSKFVKIADAVGVNIGTFTQSDLSWTLKKIRQQQAGTGSKAIRFMTAWHGSPHDHDGFDSSKIGTGEGAQAYGWGLYFAGSRKVAEYYKNTTSIIRLTGVDGKKYGDTQEGAESTARALLANYKNDRKTFDAFDDGGQSYMGKIARDIKNGIIKEASGRLYQVELAPTEDELLDWDKTYSEQSDFVKKALGRPNEWLKLVQDHGNRPLNGLGIYKSLEDKFISDKQASEHLRSLGIRGIRYLDGSSRNRPLKDIKAEFLAELPEDADTDEVMEMVGTGRFSPKNEALIKALAADDWLGFDYPAQAISAALGNSLSNYDASPTLLQAVSDAKDGGTRNYVIFDDADIKITAKESRRASNDLDFTQPQGSEPLRKTSFGYANDTHNLFHVSTFKGNDGDVSTFDVYDTNTGIKLGEVSLGLRGDEITTLANIESKDKKTGFGEQLLRSLVANNPDGIYIINMLPEAVPFWQKMGVSLDEHFEGVWEHGNGVLTEEAIQTARNSERGIAAEDSGGERKESRGSEESGRGRQADNPVSSKGVADKTAPANAGVSVSAPSESVRRIQAVVERFKSQFKGASALDIRVVSTTFDIPARFRPSPFAEGVFHDDAGLVYLVTMNLHNPRGELSENRAWQVLLHESVGHYGLSQMMGDKFASILKAVKQATLAGRKVSETQSNPLQPGDKDYTTWEAVKLRYPKASDAEVAQEVLARMSETDSGSSVLGYAVAVVRQWVREMARAMGANLVVSTSELRDLVAKASGYMRRGDNLAEERVPSGLVAASKSVGDDASIHANVQRWRDSQPIDRYDYDLKLQEVRREIERDWSNGSADDYSRRYGPGEIRTQVERENNGNYIDSDGDYTEEGQARADELESQLSENIAKNEIGEPRRRVVDLSRPKDMAAFLEWYFESHGIDVVGVGGSGKSASRYIVVDVGGVRKKLRISDHQLPIEHQDTNPSDIELPLYDRSDDVRQDGREGSTGIDENEAIHRAELLVRELRGRPRSWLESRASSPQGPIWSAPEMSRTDNIIYTMQDKNIDLKRVQQAIKATVGGIRDDIDAYLQEELFHGRAAKITEEFLDKEVNPLISLMRASNVSMDELETFLWARHAKERNAQIAKINDEMPDGGSGLTNKQADDLMAGKDVKIGDKTIEGVKPNRKEILSNLAGRVDAITGGNRALLERYSLESADTLNAWDGAYKHYVPLHREDADSHLAGMGTGMGYSVNGASSKRATGSSRPVENILANLVLQRERIITRGEKNRVAQSLYGLAKEMPNADLWEVDVKPTIRTTAMVEGREQVVDAVDPNFRNRPNVVFARFNGEDRFVVFNEHNERAVRMAQALKNLDADDISHALGEVSRWTRYFASINTQYNPIFGVTNLVRDVQTGLLNLKNTPIAGKQKEMMGHLVQALPAVFKALRADRKGQSASGSWAQLWEEFQEVGGQTGYRDMFRNGQERAEALQNALDPTWWQKTWWGKAATVGGVLAVPEQFLLDAKYGGKWVFNLLSDYNTMMENGIRLSAYKVALDSGMTKERAASLAKNLTVNFNRKGQAARQVGALYAFFNASVQGTARMAETLNHGAKPGELLGKAGKQIVYGGLLLGAVQAMLLMAAGFDDEEPPEFVRDRNIIIPTGNGKYVSIPMPLGFHVLPAISRISIEFTAGGFKKPGEHLVHIMDVLLDSFNPIGNAGLSMQTVAPTVLDPIAALTENKDWSGRQIARQDFSKLNPTPGHTRAKDTASSLSRGLAYALNYLSGGGEYGIGVVSPTPDQIDYLLGQLTGGVGREVGKVLTTGETMATGEDLPPHKIPLVGRFYGDTTGQSSEASKFYGTLEKLSEHRGTLDRMKDAHDLEAYREYAKEHPESRLYARAARVQRELASLRKLKRKMIERNADRAKVRQIEDRMRTLMTRFNQSVSEQKGDHR